MRLEAGMQIIYDVLTKGVFIEFRGVGHYLDGPFKTRLEAVRAAEEYCRKLGSTDKQER